MKTKNRVPSKLVKIIVLLLFSFVFFYVLVRQKLQMQNITLKLSKIKDLTERLTSVQFNENLVYVKNDAIYSKSATINLTTAFQNKTASNSNGYTVKNEIKNYSNDSIKQQATKKNLQNIVKNEQREKLMEYSRLRAFHSKYKHLNLSFDENLILDKMLHHKPSTNRRVDVKSKEELTERAKANYVRNFSSSYCIM